MHTRLAWYRDDSKFAVYCVGLLKTQNKSQFITVTPLLLDRRWGWSQWSWWWKRVIRSWSRMWHSNWWSYRSINITAHEVLHTLTNPTGGKDLPDDVGLAIDHETGCRKRHWCWLKGTVHHKPQTSWHPLSVVHRGRADSSIDSLIRGKTSKNWLVMQKLSPSKLRRSNIGVHAAHRM